MSDVDSKNQMSRVQRELVELRGKGTVTTQKDKFKDFDTPLTTPEEAQAFLASMRDKSKSALKLLPGPNAKPPANLTADGMNDWFLQQRLRDKEMKQRRREAEALLRGYRATFQTSTTKKERSRSIRHLEESMADPDSHDDYDQPEEKKDGDKLTIGKLKIPEGYEQSEQDQQGRLVGKLPTPQALPGQDHDQETTTTPKSTTPTTPSQPDQPDQQQEQIQTQEENDQNQPEEPTTPDQEQQEKEQEQEQQQQLQQEQQEQEQQQQEAPSPAKKIHTPNRQKSAKFKSAAGETPATPSSSIKTPNVPITEWRDFVEPDPDARFPAEKGRYHIFASYACPGSHRALIVRALKGLDEIVGVTIVHPVWRLTKQGTDEEQRGWVFGDPDGEPFPNTAGRGGPFPPCYPGNEPNPFFQTGSIRDIYEKAGDNAGKYTVPLLWDTKEQTIVNNESSDIAYMLNSSFNDFSSNPDLDLYTEEDPDRLNEVIEWLSPLMIHGVYRCGFAKRQEAYDRAITELTKAFDRADETLQQSRFLTGDTLTDADIRLFVTLLRFDEVYAFYFRANTRLVCLTPSLLNYCREIYQMNGVAPTCNMEQIKAHFYASHAEWNKFSIIPKGMGFLKLLEQPHDRNDIFGSGDEQDDNDEIPPTEN